MFPNRVKEERLAQGISQNRLGCLTGLGAARLSTIERGFIRPWPKARRVISQALGIPEQELFPPEEN